MAIALLHFEKGVPQCITQLHAAELQNDYTAIVAELAQLVSQAKY